MNASPEPVRAQIHPTAHVDAGVLLGSATTVGPGAVLEGAIRIGARCRIDAHAVLRGPLVIGDDCTFGPMTCIGLDPQVKGNPGPFGRAEIGDRNVFREFAQVHRSMKPDAATVIGDDGFFMAGAHIAHDCVVRDHVVLCNNVLLGGHVEVMDRAFLSGNVGIHQFCRIGMLTMIGGHAVLVQDAPPFAMIVGQRPAALKGLNVVGLRRAGISGEARRQLKGAFRALFRSTAPLPERLAAAAATSPEVTHLLDFVRQSERGVVGFGGGSE